MKEVMMFIVAGGAGLATFAIITKKFGSECTP